MTKQDRQQRRVTTRIGPLIEAFWAWKITCQDATFRAEALRYVCEASGLMAPASADRILRALRQAGKINYVVLSRRGSLYLALPLLPPSPEPIQERLSL